jgi:ABC-2 type transport system ATP-binding protein
MSDQATPAVLEATGLGKRYRRTWALRDCTLALPRGRIAALVGPNGAGKTTLLHLAVGLLAPTAGSIRVLGRAPGKDPDLLARVGFVAQDAPLYGDFTGADLLRLGVGLNRRFDLDLARDRLGRLGVPLDRRVDRLSGGQRAQVALAMALAKRPEVLLLDEPVASLDPLARREFLQALMGSVAEQGLTVVLSSHLLADLERVCDYLIVLQRRGCRSSARSTSCWTGTSCWSAPAATRPASPGWPRSSGPPTPPARAPCWSAPTVRCATRP